MLFLLYHTAFSQVTQKAIATIYKVQEPNSSSGTQAQNDCQHHHRHHPTFLSPIKSGDFSIKPPITFYLHPGHFPISAH